MRFSVPTIILSLCAALAPASPLPGPDTLPSAANIDLTKVYIEGMTYAGSGCKAGSVAISHRQDFSVFTLSFDDFVVSIGPGTPFHYRRKNCNLNVKLHYPPGYQYTLYQADYTDTANLEKGVSATQESQYWFSGTPRATLRTKFNGPFSGSFRLGDTLVNDALVWSPCGASTTLTINTQLYLDNTGYPQTSGYIPTDDLDPEWKILYGISWKKC